MGTLCDAVEPLVEPPPRETWAPARLLLQWHVTERCNGHCSHCYQESGGGPELPFSVLADVIGQYVALLDACSRRRGGCPTPGHVNITGGEPFIRQDILDLLDMLAVQRERFGFGVLTNGTLIDRRLARYLGLHGPAFVQVSVEGSPGMHDGIRGRGNFDRVAEGIRNLVRFGVRTLISFTAHRGNFREFPEVVRIARRLGATAVWADRLIPLGHAGDMREQVLSPAETRQFVDLVARARSDKPWWSWRSMRVDARRALQFLGCGGRPYSCQAGRTLLALLPNGDLVPCRRMPIRVGNVLQTPLAELYWRAEPLRALRLRGAPAVGCAGCPHAAGCRGGLRCLSYAVYNDPFRADPGCWLAHGSA